MCVMHKLLSVHYYIVFSFTDVNLFVHKYVMNFSTLAYAKLNLNFPQEEFIKEYDEVIEPRANPFVNGEHGVLSTIELNSHWKMVPDEEYNTSDVWKQEGNAGTLVQIIRKRRVWKMAQLMILDTSNQADPLFTKLKYFGGPALRNETLTESYRYTIKPEFANLKMWQWMNDVLPLTDIKNIHCVSMEPGSFATIHRDAQGLYNKDSSANGSRVYNEGYVVICLNVSDGGTPLYWALDGEDVWNARQTNDPVYLTNDYFLHGVGICTSRRRQVRVMGKPKKELLDLFDASSIVDVGENYNYDNSFGPIAPRPQV